MVPLKISPIGYRFTYGQKNITFNKDLLGNMHWQLLIVHCEVNVPETSFPALAWLYLPPLHVEGKKHQQACDQPVSHS